MKSKNKKVDKKVATAIKDLIEAQPAGGWTSWLFDIQNTLIQYNHLEAFTSKGSIEFANNFYTLKNFFDQVDKLENQKNNRP